MTELWTCEHWQCGKLGHDSERIVWMCVLDEGHDGECSYEMRVGTMPKETDDER